MTGKILFYPIYHEKGYSGAERSEDVRRWVNNYLFPAGIATLNEEKANAYLIATGDGGLMKVARTKYEHNKVLFGINRGTFGFLLNPVTEINQIPTCFEEINLIKLKLIQAEFILTNGEKKFFLAFNDIFCGGEISDYPKFTISGSLSHFPSRTVYGNGIIISTPQGTTAYTLKARGSSAVLPLDTNSWVISGVATGPYPNDQVSPQKITIDIESRTPVNGYADGKAQKVEDVKRIIITPTPHTITLGFLSDIDFPARRRNLAQKAERGE